MVVFLGNQSGKSKTTGNPYNRYTLLEVKKDEQNGGKLVGRVHEFFADKEIALNGIECGDIVKARFEERSELEERKTLVGLDKVDESVFKLVV